MMDEITYENIIIAKAKIGALEAVLDDLRQCDAVWKDIEIVGRVDRLWKDLEKLSEQLDNTI